MIVYYVFIAMLLGAILVLVFRIYSLVLSIGRIIVKESNICLKVSGNPPTHCVRPIGHAGNCHGDWSIKEKP